MSLSSRTDSALCSANLSVTDRMASTEPSIACNTAVSLRDLCSKSRSFTSTASCVDERSRLRGNSQHRESFLNIVALPVATASSCPRSPPVSPKPFLSPGT